jgi:pyruvate/2-oxoglutarate dehydrogenase complex dihydrolipoamide acyltransferase (E2) component
MTEPNTQQRPIVMPDIGAEEQTLQLVQWLVEPGDEVLSGDRLAEVVAAGVLFYVQSPFNGMIVSLDKPTGAQVNPGNVLARMRIDES